MNVQQVDAARAYRLLQAQELLRMAGYEPVEPLDLNGAWRRPQGCTDEPLEADAGCDAVERCDCVVPRDEAGSASR